MIYSPMGTLLGVHPILPNLRWGISPTSKWYPRRLRFQDNPDGAPTFSPCDVFLLSDGGRGGHMICLPDSKDLDCDFKLFISNSVCIHNFTLQEIRMPSPHWSVGVMLFRKVKRPCWWYTMRNQSSPGWVSLLPKIPSCSSFDHLPKAWSKAQLCHQASWDSACAHATKWGKGCEESKACTNHILLIFKVLFTHHFLPSSDFCIRLHYNGTNRGDVIYGAKMPGLDGPTVWKMTVGEKKELYGKHRIAVGGAAPADAIEEGGLDLFNEMIHIIIQRPFVIGKMLVPLGWYP